MAWMKIFNTILHVTGQVIYDSSDQAHESSQLNAIDRHDRERVGYSFILIANCAYAGPFKLILHGSHIILPISDPNCIYYYCQGAFIYRV